MRKKLIAIMLLGVITLPLLGKPKYRIVEVKIEGATRFIPEIKKRESGYLMNQWVSLSNQPLSSFNEAKNYIVENRNEYNKTLNDKVVNVTKIY